MFFSSQYCPVAEAAKSATLRDQNKHAWRRPGLCFVLFTPTFNDVNRETTVCNWMKAGFKVVWIPKEATASKLESVMYVGINAFYHF